MQLNSAQTSIKPAEGAGVYTAEHTECFFFAAPGSSPDNIFYVFELLNERRFFWGCLKYLYRHVIWAIACFAA